MMIHVVEPGHSVLTDLGRFRGPGFGLPVNGALDQFAARVANALVGNVPDAPLLELTAFDVSFRPDCDVLIAVTGAVATITVDGYPQEQWEPVAVHAGQVVRVAQLRLGLRAYVAAFGSFEAPQLMGSCAPDTVLGFGTRLRAGDRLGLVRRVPSVRNPRLGVPMFHFPVPRVLQPYPLVIDLVDGPDAEQFGATAGRLFEGSYRVGAQSNHVGLRLAGPMPVRQSTAEILSRGVPVGAVEAPAGTELLVLHRGRGVTAGYPVLAVVTEPSLDLLAQVRPGDELSFHRTSLGRATSETRARRAAVERLADAAVGAYEALGLFDRADGDPRWSAQPATAPPRKTH